MPIKILMPALSPTMETGNLTKWSVKVGDAVKSGMVLAEIETDKATMEVEAVDEGVVAKLVVAEGAADVPVNAVIAILAEEGEDVEAAASAAEGAAPAPAKAEAPKVEDKAKPEASKADTAKAEAPKAEATKSADGERIFASPLARRVAKDKGLDLKSIKGSGPKGRIILRDVEGAEAAPKAAAPAPQAQGSAPAPKPAGASDEMTLKLFDPDSYELIPHDGMRKTIARRLTESKQTVPHFYVTVDVELDALLVLRKDINDSAPTIDGKPTYKVSVNDMVIKAYALALKAVPDAHVSWTDGGMLKHRHADVGVAVSIPGGLITPIVRKADEKSLSAISNEVKDLAKRAKDRKLKPEEYQGGTTSVSNLGMFGVKDFAAVINPPHATILAVGAGEQRAVVKGGQLAVATVMSVTLSTDHRAVDGALGAELLKAFKGFIEKPMSMLV
ncbi:pyruvate dehydrogenase complex dihydrolipoamide acetyltransferase [Pleomorphomonas sp. JP5]|uniref:pyruvate dehydrogenase complex dihydrolipoamide acetyltransferase n=1 Tax=Pleomorphomonas sp. JP5 TaxID=2942998 RepID=UPI002044C0D9|nr:pyruvate dehydrogenase complex dihydrolipoamide acetyltransferase [Pleomorphomonas sp. JP5]MCM5559981.1 pyruvate dehydrogenase complex dihydrolipoamide acetyltransferase [Pleomorphomonas sp. JP5]